MWQKQAPAPPSSCSAGAPATSRRWQAAHLGHAWRALTHPLPPVLSAKPLVQATHVLQSALYVLQLSIAIAHCTAGQGRQRQWFPGREASKHQQCVGLHGAWSAAPATSPKCLARLGMHTRPCSPAHSRNQRPQPWVRSCCRRPCTCSRRRRCGSFQCCCTASKGETSALH